MRVSSVKATWALLLACAAAACTSNPAPKGWLRSPSDAGADPRGAWIAIYGEKEASQIPRAFPAAAPEEVPVMGGEFLAVGADTVYILTEDGVVQRVPTSTIRTARVAFFDSGAKPLGVWTAVGSISTLPANGAFMVFTLPSWLIVGGGATASQTRAPVVDVAEGESWSTVRPYARFPDGLPPSGLPGRMPPVPRR